MTSMQGAKRLYVSFSVLGPLLVFGCGGGPELGGEQSSRMQAPLIGDRVRKINLPSEIGCTVPGIGDHVAISMLSVPRAALGLSGSGLLLGTSCRSTSEGGRIFFVDPGPSDPSVPEIDGTVAHTLDLSYVPPNGWGSFSFRGDTNPPDLLGCTNSANDTEPHQIYRIDLQTGTATFYFEPIDQNGDPVLPTPGRPYCDGLAWDSWNDTVFFSNDISDTIYQYAPPNPDVPGSGATFIKTLAVPSPGCFDGGVPTGNSGIEVVGNSLFLGCNGQETIFEIDQRTGAVVRQFDSGAERAEDLACDAETFRDSDLNVVWTKDAFSPTMIGFEAPPGSCGLCREDFRRDLNSLSTTEQQDIATLLSEYLTSEVISVHNANFGLWHGNGSLFIPAHRGYVGGFEIWLLNVKNRPDLVPLPKWHPANPIPTAFQPVLTSACMAAGGSSSECVPIVNATPNLPLPADFQFTDASGTSGLCQYPDYRTLHEGGSGLPSLEFSYHNGVHTTVAGAMSFGFSPSALVFFPWHAFIDDVSREWECRCQGLCQSCTDVFQPTFSLTLGPAASGAPPIGFWWWFEEQVVPPDVTPTTLKDHSGFSFDGRVRGNAALVPGEVGQAMAFDGSDDFVEVRDTTVGEVGSTDFTIETWVRSGATGIQPIVEKLASNGVGYSLFLNNGRPALYLRTAGATREFTSPTALPAGGGWHHVAAVVKRGQVNGARLLIDGVTTARFDTQPLTGSLSAGGMVLIGRSLRLASPRLLTGSIDELTLLRSALTDNAAASIFRAGGAGKFGALSRAPMAVEMPSCIDGVGALVAELGEQHISQLYQAVLAAVAAGSPQLVQTRLDELLAHVEQHMATHPHSFGDPEGLLLHAIHFRALICRDQQGPEWLSFEDPVRRWTRGVGTVTLTQTTAESSHRNQSLQVSGCGYAAIDSPVFQTKELALGSRLAVDIRLPTIQPNPNWYGDVQVHVSIPSAGINNLWIGQRLLTGLSTATWHTLTYSLPAQVRTALAQNRNDVQVRLAVNTGNCSAPLFLDNVRTLP
jgi:hypothetical protein